MANPIRKLVQLVLDKNAARKTEADTKKALGGIDKAVGGLKSTFLKLGAVIGGVFAVKALFNFTKSLFLLNSSIAETASKFSTVWGTAADNLREFSDEFAELSGLSRRVTQDFIATLGAMIKGMGASIPLASDLSKTIIGLVGDLTSFHDVPLEETFNALRSGITGEAEPLKRFGIILSENEVQLRALINTGKESATQLTALEKVVARVQLIYEKSGDALGDLGRTQDSNSNKTRQLSGAWQTLRETFAQVVFGAAEAGGALDGMIQLIKDLTAFVEANGVTFQRWGQRILDTAEGIVGFLEREMERWDPLAKFEREHLEVILAMSEDRVALDQKRFEIGQEILATAREIERVEESIAEKKGRRILPLSLVEDQGLLDELEGQLQSLQLLALEVDRLADRLAESKDQKSGPVGGAAVGGAGVGGAGVGVSEGLPVGRVEAMTAAWASLNQEMELSPANAAALADQLVIARAEAESYTRQMEAAGFAGQIAGDLLYGAFGQGIPLLAKQKAQQNAILAAEQLAEGFVLSLNPLTAGLAGAHYAAAGKYAAIATAWGGLAGATGGFGGGGGGGGAPSDTGGAASERTEAPGPEVHIHFVGPGFNAVNPEVQRVIYGAQQEISQRYGNAKPKIHRDR